MTQVKTAVILAGGLGTRLSNVVPHKQKVLADVSGTPFLEYLLRHLFREGISSVVLCTGHLGNQVNQRFGTSYRGMALRYSQENSPLGTGGALRLALPLLSADPVIVLNGDSYCDVGFNDLAAWHTGQRSKATLVLSQTTDTRRFGRVTVEGNGHVTCFSEKANSAEPGWINAGVYLLDREMLQSIPIGRPVSLEREIFPDWIGQGLCGYCTMSRVWDIGVPEAYAEANDLFIRSLPSRRAL